MTNFINSWQCIVWRNKGYSSLEGQVYIHTTIDLDMINDICYVLYCMCYICMSTIDLDMICAMCYVLYCMREERDRDGQ